MVDRFAKSVMYVAVFLLPATGFLFGCTTPDEPPANVTTIASRTITIEWPIAKALIQNCGFEATYRSVRGRYGEVVEEIPLLDMLGTRSEVWEAARCASEQLGTLGVQIPADVYEWQGHKGEFHYSIDFRCGTEDCRLESGTIGTEVGFGCIPNKNKCYILTLEWGRGILVGNYDIS